MKKNLLLVLGLGLALNSTAQVGKQIQKFENRPIKLNDNVTGYHTFSKKGNDSFTAKAGGDTLFYDNFSDISASGTNWTIDNAGETAADRGWANVATSRKWYADINPKINSHSAGKFLEVMNGKYVSASNITAATNITYIATSPAITIPNKNVTINFLQYGAIFNDSQIMEVSADGNNWEQIFTNDNRITFNGADPSAIYTNPEAVEVNLGVSGLPVNTTTLYVRFKFSSRFPSETNKIAWITFGWMIDDLTVTENYISDLKNEKSIVSSKGIRYSIIPTSQSHDVPVGNILLNNGSSDLSNVRSFVKITTPSGVINDTVNGSATLAAYATDTVEHSITLNNQGTYSVSKFGGLFDGVDEVASNDTSGYSFSFNYGGTIYALDLGSVSNYDYDPENSEYHVGNAFDIYSNVKATGVDIYMFASSNGNVKGTEGTEIFGAIRKYESGFPVVDATPLYSIGAGDNNKWITLVFDSPVDLTNGSTYLVTVGTYGTSATTGMDFVIRSSGNSLSGTSLYFTGSQNNWFRMNSDATPMVRLNLTPGIVSTKNLGESVKANIYPNPAKDVAVIDYNTAFDGDVKVSVIDLNGKAVYSNTFANQAAGNNKIELNVNNYTSGVYQVVIEANSSMITKKLVIK